MKNTIIIGLNSGLQKSIRYFSLIRAFFWSIKEPVLTNTLFYNNKRVINTIRYFYKGFIVYKSSKVYNNLNDFSDQCRTINSLIIDFNRWLKKNGKR